MSDLPAFEREHALVPLVWAAAATVVTVGVVAIVATAVGGDRALAGALVGGLAVLGVLLFGVLQMALVVRFVPKAAVLAAMTTYALQVVVLMVLFAAYLSSPEMQDQLASGWLGGSIAAATAAWVTGQVVASFRAGAQ